MNRDFKGIWIPREIWLRDDLSSQEKCLWAEIYSLYDREKGGCYASEDYLCEFMKVKRSRLYEILKKLKKAKLLETVAFDGRCTIRRAILPEDSAIESWKEGVRKAGRRSGKPDSESGKPDSPGPGSRTGGDPSPYIHYNKGEIIIAQTPKKALRNTAPVLHSRSDNICCDIQFCFEKREFLNISEKDLDSWRQIYPDVNVALELKEMSEWLLSNPSRAKKKLYRKFITTWLAKEQDKNSNQKAYRETKAKSQKEDPKVTALNAELEIETQNRHWFRSIREKIYPHVSDSSWDYVEFRTGDLEDKKIFYKDSRFKELIKTEIKNRKLL